MKVNDRKIHIQTIDRVFCTHCGQIFTRVLAKHNYGGYFSTHFGRAVAKWKKQHRCAEKMLFSDFFFLPTGNMNRGCHHYRRPRNIIESSMPTCLCTYSPSEDCKPDTCPRMHHEEPQTEAS